MKTRPTEERFWAKVTGHPSGCWIWGACLNWKGYGLFGLRPGKNVAAHRFAYELMIAPIPEGLQTDHLCRNRGCVNPTHMELVTARENVLRGIGHTAINARKTHCLRGHEYTPDNTYWTADGWRACRTCNRNRARRKVA